MDRFLLNGQNNQKGTSIKDKISPLPVQYQLFLKVHGTSATPFNNCTIIFPIKDFFFFPFYIFYLKQENCYDLSHRKYFYNIK